MRKKAGRFTKSVAEIRAIQRLPDGLWDAVHVAAFLKVSLRRVYDLPGLVRTELPGNGRAKDVRWHPDDVKEWARRCRKVAS